MIVVMKKDWMWRNSRSSHRKNQRENINHLRRQQQSDQGEKQQVGGLIDSSKLCGGDHMRPRLACSFSKSRNPKERDVLKSTKRQQLTLVSLIWGKRGGSINMVKGQEWTCHNLDFFGGPRRNNHVPPGKI